MFERYTEKARRAVFFARYEANQYGSHYIETGHLLLGILRDDPRAFKWSPKFPPIEVVRQRIESWVPARDKTSMSVDLPLSTNSRRVLVYAMDEADRLNSKNIGTEHLFLGLLREQDSKTAKLLLEFGADLEKLRSEFAKQMQEPYSSIADRARERILGSTFEVTTIQGAQRALQAMLDAATRYRLQNAHWRKRSWTPLDAIVEKKTGKLSLDLTLAEDSVNFELLKGGWKKDHCGICRWELFESKDDVNHGTGYTNGRDWVCTACYERFWNRPDFIAGSYSEIT